MDKVKAIEVLKPLVESYVDHANITMKEEDDDIADALEMAVEALKALDVPDMNVGDMISRHMVIEALAKQMPKSYTLDGSHPADEEIFKAQEVYADCIKTIKLLPAVQPDHNADVSKKVDGDDCISRRVAKEKLKQNLTYMQTFGVDRCMNLIDEIPAVEPESKWISCEEKMPEENLWTGASQQYSYGVLMYVLDYSDGDTIIDFGHTIDGKWYSDTADTYVENYSCRVIAWMLPPSYKENE